MYHRKIHFLANTFVIWLDGWFGKRFRNLIVISLSTKNKRDGDYYSPKSNLGMNWNWLVSGGWVGLVRGGSGLVWLGMRKGNRGGMERDRSGVMGKWSGMDRSGMIRSRGRMVRSSLVRSRGIRLRLIFGVDGGAFVFDIGNVTIVMISSVGHSLDTTVGKVNLIGSRNSLAVSSFMSIEVGSRVLVMNSVLKGIGFGGFIVVRVFVGSWVRSWLVRGRVGSWFIRGWMRSWMIRSSMHWSWVR